MSFRELISPSRSITATPKVTSEFRLQPPPHQYREKRKGRILSTEDILSSKDSRREKEQPNNRIDDACTIHGVDLDMYERPKRLLSGDIRLFYPTLTDIHPTSHGSVLTSPVKSDLRNSAFFTASKCQEEVIETDDLGGNTLDTEPPPTASTSSFSGAARSTFGFSLRKRGSQQSQCLSPTSPSNSERHVTLNLSPMSPLTPKRYAALHTPCHLHFESSRINTHLVVQSSKDCDVGNEPLSATLKRLGAARQTLFIGEEEENNIMDRNTRVAAQDWERRMTERIEVQKKAADLIASNRQILRESEGLFKKSANEEVAEANDEKYTHSWLNTDSGRPLANTDREKNQTYKRLQSTTRGGQQSAFFRSTLGRLSITLTNYIFSKPSNTNQKLDCDIISMQAIGDDGGLTRPDLAVPREKGDGWGGLRPRSSWFPGLGLGPLTSPTRESKSVPLRPLHLKGGSTGSCFNVEDEWIDEEEEQPLIIKQEGETPNEEEMTMKKLRVKFPSYLYKPSRDGRQSSTSLNDGIIVEYTKTSAEGRPASKGKMRQLLSFFRSQFGLWIALLIVVCMAAILAIIAASAIGRIRNPSLNQDMQQSWTSPNHTAFESSNTLNALDSATGA
jgi:hypothetical protein